MKIVVLIAGVNDPKWPIAPEVAVRDSGEQRILSPFDDAALEAALRIREAHPAAEIIVRIVGGEATSKIARAVLALKISDVATLLIERAWDQAAVAQAMVPLCEGADLVLLGREFGDFDDGLVPSMLAGLLEIPFFGRAQAVSTEGGVHLMRERDRHIERVALTGPLLASVTNDRRTRLRKPLMKNVMLARQAAIVRLADATPDTTGIALERLTQAAPSRASADCTLLDGPIERQAQGLADLLWEARA